MLHSPTIHDKTMHDSCINYPKKLKLCRENYAAEKPNLAEQKTDPLLHAEEHFLRQQVDFRYVFYTD